MRDQVEAALVQRAQLADMADAQPLTFLASIAPLQSAITVASDGGARIKIDIPESEMPAIVRLMLCRGKTLRITVEIVPEAKDEPAVISWRERRQLKN